MGRRAAERPAVGEPEQVLPNSYWRGKATFGSPDFNTFNMLTLLSQREVPSMRRLMTLAVKVTVASVQSG